MDKLFIIVPAYNEAANIENLIEDWYPIVERHNGNGESQLVVIDDSSKDNTYSILKRLAEERPFLKPLTKPNGGHGPTVLFGYKYAIENGADYIFQTDSDGQTNSAEFEKFWELRECYDAIIGDRSDRQDGTSRIFVEKILVKILRLVFGVKVPDSNAPFRLMKAELVKKYITKMPEDFNLPNVMLTTYFVYFKEKIKFEYVSFRPRQGGTNSINIKKITKIGLRAVLDFAKLRRHIND